MKPFLAFITPLVSGAHPDHELPKPPAGAKPPAGGAPPVVDNTLPGNLPHPSHPIYYPLPPGAPVDPSYGVPLPPPTVDNTLPGQRPRPDHSLPGAQPGIDNTLPIVPPDGGAWEPVFIWGPTDPRPTPPINLPPDGPAPGGGGKIEWEAVWTPANGWQTIGVIVPDAPTITPSKK